MVVEEELCEKWKPVAAMVVVQIALAGLNVLVKRVFDEGMSPVVLVTYRQSVSAVFTSPIAYFWERKSRPKMTWSIFFHLFLSAMLWATLTQYWFFLGIRYTSPTYACAFINMVPVATFLISLPFGLETVNMKNNGGRTKVLGTTVSVGGAMVLALYKGIAFSSRHNPQPIHNNKTLLGKKKWTKGTLALLGGCLSWSSWFALQARIGKRYPSLYSSNAILSFLSAIQTAALNLMLGSDPRTWVLKGRMEVLTTVYAGVVGSSLCFILTAWCVKRRGPVFAAAFSPLIQMIVAIVDFLFLQEQLHMGSILGSALIVVGLYLLLWGKSMETESFDVKQVQILDETQESSLPA